MFSSQVTRGQRINPIESAVELFGAGPHAPLPAGEVYVRSNMVLSLNGSATINGSSRALGDAIDAELVDFLRQWSDVVVVGAGTVREENYFGVRMTEETARVRRSHGQSDVPPIAVLTEQFSINPKSQFFTNTFCPPLILSPTKSLEDPNLREKRIQITEAGGILIDAGLGTAEDVVKALSQLGLRKILLEGGPSLFGAFSVANLINTYHFTISPLLSIPVEKPVFSFADKTVHRNLTLVSSGVSRSGTIMLRYDKKSYQDMD